MPATNATTPAPTTDVVCPACDGRGETTTNPTRTPDGIWDRNTRPCFLCQATGTVTPDIADEYHHHINQERP